ncbi:ATP-binding protein [Kitasatospora sp. NPDC059571]|uniref:ATP-binding protein n=1 Tax=Kitasatospora sp. NPDC059571 TaxID=3346871 RepID=UPI003680395D
MSSDQNGRGGQTPGTTPTERPLHEREAELDAAEHAVSRLCRKFAAGGTEIGEVLLFSGPGGMGKTSLLDQVRRLAGLRPKCTVLFARGGERQRNEPFHVLRQLLQPVLGALSANERNEVFGGWYGIVGPAIGLVPPSDELEPLDPQGVRDGLDFVFTQLAPRFAPLVLVVDDLHWADQESLGWLASFAVRSRELPVLLVLAYRDEFDHPAQLLRQQIEGIARYRHELRRLTPDTVADIVRAELGEHADDAFCRQVWAVTGGIPFDIGALLREVRDQGLEASEENARELHDLAAAARGETLQHWLDKLGPTTLHFAWACALLGTDIRQPLAATIAGQGPDQADDSVRKLRKQRVLTSQPNGRLEFVHPRPHLRHPVRDRRRAAPAGRRPRGPARRRTAGGGGDRARPVPGRPRARPRPGRPRCRAAPRRPPGGRRGVPLPGDRTRPELRRGRPAHPRPARARPGQLAPQPAAHADQGGAQPG